MAEYIKEVQSLSDDKQLITMGYWCFGGGSSCNSCRSKYVATLHDNRLHCNLDLLLCRDINSEAGKCIRDQTNFSKSAFPST